MIAAARMARAGAPTLRLVTTMISSMSLFCIFFMMAKSWLKFGRQMVQPEKRYAILPFTPPVRLPNANCPALP